MVWSGLVILSWRMQTTTAVDDDVLVASETVPPGSERVEVSSLEPREQRGKPYHQNRKRKRVEAAWTCSEPLFWIRSTTAELERYFQLALESLWCRQFSIERKEDDSASTRGDDPVAGAFYHDDAGEMEAALNQVKSGVGEIDPDRWSALTNYTDLASPLRYSIKANRNLDLPTNAWLKFWSILHQFPQLTDFSQFSSVHLCEAPGAFVASLNHFLATRKSELHAKWKWMASSLSPYCDNEALKREAILEDTLIIATLANWVFGADGTGDLKRVCNRDCIVEEARKRLGCVYLVTADGGLDCSADPAGQEENLVDLKLAEAVTALIMLADGGNFVLKIFTIFRRKTALLLHLLSRAFDQVHLYKPPTSKAGNSEIYVVCLGYHASAVADDLATLSVSLTFGSLDCIAPEFAQELLAASKYFSDLQSDAILTNLAVFEVDRNRRVRLAFHNAKQQFTCRFSEISPIGEIDPLLRLMT